MGKRSFKVSILFLLIFATIFCTLIEEKDVSIDKEYTDIIEEELSKTNDI
ncbi:hypothetical protein [Miniphocaeibacter massiliensis]|nr:hypothetical protein [Miniphocaeibacter massiliensis]